MNMTRTRSLPRSARWLIPESIQASYATSSSLRSCGSILCDNTSASSQVHAAAAATAALRLCIFHA